MDMSKYNETTNVKDAAKELMNKHGNTYRKSRTSILMEPFLFFRFGWAWFGKKHPTVQKVIERGGEYRQKVSGATNYLVVNPGETGEKKINAVIEQMQKGKNIKIIYQKPHVFHIA